MWLIENTSSSWTNIGIEEMQRKAFARRRGGLEVFMGDYHQHLFRSQHDLSYIRRVLRRA